MVFDAALLSTHHCKDQGSSGAILGMKLRSPLHFGVVATEKGAVGSSFVNFTYTYKNTFCIK